ncbi:MAG: hypothetical protein D4Q77_01970 [Methanothrix sp.]|nr:MAG: hypothetical protein D4Q77_01970 [Methanothrix sp.]
MKKLLFLLALIVAAFSGCVEEGPSAEDLKTMMIDAVQDIETVTFTMVTDQTTTITNVTDSETIITYSRGEGEVNMTAQAMKLFMVTTSKVGAAENVTMGVEMYMLEDALYMKIDGNWTKMTRLLPEGMLDQQNQLKMQMEMLNNSVVELEGSEMIDGLDTYVLKVVPDMDAFSATMDKQMGSMSIVGMNLTDLYSSAEMEWTTWLSKDSYLPLKIQVNTKMKMTPGMIGLPVEDVGDFDMLVESDSMVLYHDYNLPVVIELPHEAKNATDMSTLLGMAATVPVAK